MRRTLALLVALTATAAATAAPMPAIDFTAPTTAFTNGQWSLGFQFATGAQGGVVTHLGFWDDGGNGFAGNHTVGIYNLSGVLLASGVVTSGSSLGADNFRYVDIADLTLDANTSYRIAGTTGTDNYTWNPTGFTTSPLITFQGDRFTSSATLVFPTSSSGVDGWFGPNFIITETPEPISIIVFGGLVVGGAGIALRRRMTAKAVV